MLLYNVGVGAFALILWNEEALKVGVDDKGEELCGLFGFEGTLASFFGHLEDLGVVIWTLAEMLMIV